MLYVSWGSNLPIGHFVLSGPVPYFPLASFLADRIIRLATVGVLLQSTTVTGPRELYSLPAPSLPTTPTEDRHWDSQPLPTIDNGSGGSLLGYTAYRCVQNFRPYLFRLAVLTVYAFCATPRKARERSRYRWVDRRWEDDRCAWPVPGSSKCHRGNTMSGGFGQALIRHPNRKIRDTTGSHSLVAGRWTTARGI